MTNPLKNTSHIDVVLLKLGGSLITDKNTEKTVRYDVLRSLIQQISRARQQLPSTTMLVIGHGQGSFAHVAAKKFNTIDGVNSLETRLGAIEVQTSAQELNSILMHEFFEQGLPAVSWPAHGTIRTTNKQLNSIFLDTLESSLRFGFLPVTGGDVVQDTELGATIWSTEQVLNAVAEHISPDEFSVQRIIHAGEVEGFLGSNNQVIESITRKTWSELESQVFQTQGIADVTGGMKHKVEECLLMADRGVESYVISGLLEHNLYNAILDLDWKGTRIS